ncbi:unnamed protein product [Calypogeia fissa]
MEWSLAYDGCKTIGGLPRVFTLKGICMWTMHDYPGYGFVSGLQTQGYKAPFVAQTWRIWPSTHPTLEKLCTLDIQSFFPLDMR